MDPKDVIKPEILEKGDVVGIISPSTPIYSKKDLSRGIRALEKLGFKPKLAEEALAVSGGYLAGTREQRLKDLHRMFLDDEVKAIFCTGGGYSSLQLLPDIDWDIIQKNPKIFMGYSDITTLLIAMHEKTGMVTFHGPMVQGLRSETKGQKFTMNSFEETLTKGKTGKVASFTEWKTLKKGRAEGTLIGGNLNTILGLIGTPYEPKWDGKILFWEETDETIEGIDNYLWKLRIAKVFKKIEGMIVGKISNMHPIDEDDGDTWGKIEKPPMVEDVILEATKGFDFPILYGVDFGHDVPNLTLPIGAKASLDCSEEGRIGKLAITEKYLKD
jgi:muramoyltetrapeptide carboxypeptidase